MDSKKRRWQGERLVAMVIAQLLVLLGPALAWGEDAHRHPWVFLAVTLGVVALTVGAHDAGFLRGAVVGAAVAQLRAKHSPGWPSANGADAAYRVFGPPPKDADKPD